MLTCLCGLLAGRHVALTLLGQAPAGGGPPSATPRHLAESTVALSTPAGPLTGNPVLDREKISAPQAVDVSTCISLPRCFFFHFTEMYKKLTCRRETARRFVSLNILLSHSRSFETTLLSRRV